MDSLIALNDVQAAEQLRFCIGFCGPDLYKIIKSCIAPKKISDTSYLDMKKELQSYFEPKLNQIAERFKFYTRQQKSDETVTDFIVEIKALTQTCDFGDHLAEALRDKLVFGVHDQKIQAALLREKDLTFDRACTIAKSFDMTRQNVELMHGETNVSAFAKNRLGPKTDQNRVMRGNRRSRYAGYQCFSCGHYGHTSRNCQAKAKANHYKGHSSRKSRVNEMNGESSDQDNESDQDGKCERYLYSNGS